MASFIDAVSSAAIPEYVQTLSNSKLDDVAACFQVKRSPLMYVRPGYIVRVKIENFLTHQNKTVDFTMPITLIHGANGSGKSSILQAIHFCLCSDKRMVRQDIKSWGDFKTRARVQGQIESGVAYTSAVTVYFANGTILKRRIEASDTTSFWLASAQMTLCGERMRKSTVAAVKQTLF